MLATIYHMLKDGTFYQDLGPDYYERQRNHNRHVSRLVGCRRCHRYRDPLTRTP